MDIDSSLFLSRIGISFTIKVIYRRVRNGGRGGVTKTFTYI